MSRPKPRHALPPPLWRRRWVWAVAALLVVVGGWLMLRGSEDDPFEEPAFNTTSTPTSTSTTTAPAVACLDVANPSLLMTIAADAASAVVVDGGWFVAKANGATWYTTANISRDAAGELVPLNDQARVDSSSRRDVPYGDPLYEGHTDAEPEADAVRACATG